MQTPRALAVALLVLACAPKSADTDGGSSSSLSSGAQTDSAGATSATNTSPTTGVDSTTSPTGASASDDTGTSTTGTTGTTTGTGEPGTDDTGGGGLPGACEAAFARLDGCDPGSVGAAEEWIPSCNSLPADVLPECEPALVVRWSCIAMLSCEEAKKLQAGEPTSCTRELHAADVACVDQGCSGEVGSSGETCQHSKVCNGLAQGIVCDPDVCTCTEHHVPVGECPANGLCDLGPDELPAAIDACCGWTP